MALPLFTPADDPGPDFAGLVRRIRTPASTAVMAARAPAAGPRRGGVRHGTTVVAVRFADGMVMAGDRRATEGHSIAHRAMEKVFPADRYSAVAIAGAAGPGRRDGPPLPDPARALREGRGGRPQPRGQGQPARPDGARAPAHGHAGPRRGAPVRRLRPVAGDRADLQLRRDRRPLRGDRAQRHGLRRSGRPHHHQAGLPGGMARDEAVELAIEALYEAADEDSATGGPDLVRGIYPLVAAVTADGFAFVADDRGGRAVRRADRPTPCRRDASHDHALLRGARAGDEGPGRVRPEGHRPGPLAGGHHLRRRAS